MIKSLYVYLVLYKNNFYMEICIIKTDFAYFNTFFSLNVSIQIQS